MSVRTAAPGIVRPRLRPDHPLLWRTDGCLQVGLGTRAPVISEATTAIARWLCEIDGTRDWAQVDARIAVHGLDPALAARVIRALHGSGAIDDAGAMPEPLRWVEREVRDALAADLAAAAFTYGTSTDANLVVTRRRTTSIEVVGMGNLADAVRSTVAASGMPSTTDDADLRIIAVPGHPSIASTIDDPAVPHLLVAVFGDAGVAGPLVIPGRTSCLRCAHLHRRDADPDWAVLALQMASSVQRLRVHPTDRLLAHAVAARAVLLARRWIDDPDGAWGNVAIEVHLPDGHGEPVARPPHPLCGCLWTDAGRAA